MSIFSLNIEKLHEVYRSKGLDLKGIFAIQYPVYCIHSRIVDSTPEPLDNFDMGLVKMLLAKNDLTYLQLASLLGTTKKLIEARIIKLINDGLLVQQDKSFFLTEEGIKVFQEDTLKRKHRISYDFFIDGLTFEPLSKVFYESYRLTLISQHDKEYYTDRRDGSTKSKIPFGPDIVHRPPDDETIIDSILSIPVEDREKFKIPEGIETIEEISYTQMSFRLLVSACSSELGMVKELIDGYSVYNLNEPYYETLRRNVKCFEDNIRDRLSQLVFKIITPRPRMGSSRKPPPIIITNWNQADPTEDYSSSCFVFSIQDLMDVIDRVFSIKHVSEDSIINNDRELQIKIDYDILMDSPFRYKIISDLIRGRDYKFGSLDNNVFLLYLNYITNDELVLKVVEFSKAINKADKHNISLKQFENEFSEYKDNYRKLLIACGEFELLERFDIESCMNKGDE
ncbi:hypothetical protein [Ekhidna sp.]|uniref:hypothetical protein n=1 Tax=Ekhidna sp. TaxID=2608089 RepID=UPI0035144E48